MTFDPLRNAYADRFAVIFKLNYSRPDANGGPQRKDVKLKGIRYMEVMSKLHDSYPRVFNPRPVYDGVKNMFSSIKIDSTATVTHSLIARLFRLMIVAVYC